LTDVGRPDLFEPGVALGSPAIMSCQEPQPRRSGIVNRWIELLHVAWRSPCGHMERSEPLAGVSRWPSAVPDIDPRAGRLGTGDPP